MGLREKIGSVIGRRFATISIPMYGEIRLRSLDSADHREMRGHVRDKNGDVDPAKYAMYDELVIAYAVVDADGNPEFTPQEALAGYIKMDAGCRMRLMEEIKKHTGIGADDGWSPVVSAAKN